jgi:recombinational DNA repair protein RecR
MKKIQSFKPKVSKCKLCGILYASRLDACPLCSNYKDKAFMHKKKVRDTFTNNLKEKYGETNL